MARNPGQPLDLQNIPGGDALPVPMRKAGTTAPDGAGHVRHAEPVVAKDLAEGRRIVHGVVRFHNSKPKSRQLVLKRGNDFSETSAHSPTMTNNFMAGMTSSAIRTFAGCDVQGAPVMCGCVAAKKCFMF